MKTVKEYLAAFQAARSVATPLVAVRTPDPASTLQVLQPPLAAVAKAQKESDPPIVHWDIIRGMAGVNADGKKAVQTAIGNAKADMVTVRPTDALSKALALPDNSVLFFANAHKWCEDPTVVQAIWNLRDEFKGSFRMLILMLSPGATLPAEISQDVLMLDEPLPSAGDLEGIVRKLLTESSIAVPDQPEIEKAVDALVGLAAFPAEQVTAMSLTRKGINTEALWERKRQVIETTRGLGVWRGGETFDDIGGCANVKAFLQSVIAGAEPPRVVVFIDEIEKAFAGFGTDSSGVKTEMIGTLLSWMQDNEADGCIFIGPPGAAKSAIAKATGNTANIPTIAFDMAGMQEGIVGTSGSNLRTALKIVTAVSQGRALFIATCNSIASLPPELRRRFTLGTFFFDLPNMDERERIWAIYETKYKVSGPRPQDDGWTGAEIKECCRKAWKLSISLSTSAEYIVPVSKSASEQILLLRSQASDKFISASYSGVYVFDEEIASRRGGARKMSLGVQ